MAFRRRHLASLRRLAWLPAGGLALSAPFDMPSGAGVAWMLAAAAILFARVSRNPAPVSAVPAKR